MRTMKNKKQKLFFQRKQKVSCHLTRKKTNKGLNSFWYKFWNDICRSSTLHGIGYLAREDRTLYERVVWASMFFLAILTATYLSSSIWIKYTTSSTVTVVESTTHSCGNIPFPSVTICDTSRVDWSKVIKLELKNIPTKKRLSLSPNVTMNEISILLNGLAQLSFGDFHHLAILDKANIDPDLFKNVDVSKLLKRVQRSCSEIFQGPCWWRDKNYDCCTLFELQRTGAGFCYSFNNDLSEESKGLSSGYGTHEQSDFWLDQSREMRPRRSATHGAWSGLRVTINVMNVSKMPPKNNIATGVQIFINNPRHFPIGDNFLVAPGMNVDINILGDTLKAQDNVRHLEQTVRKCLFPDEKISWSGIYQQHNCNAECRQNYALLHCNCSPDFLFFQDVFNSMLPPPIVENIFFKSKTDGMQCQCYPDCSNQKYVAEVSTYQNLNSSSITQLDFHYRLPYNILYRTNVSFDWLELIVAFGGVAGICLGGSVLSVAEVIYFFTYRLFYYWNQNYKMNVNKRKRNLLFVADSIY